MIMTDNLITDSPEIKTTTRKYFEEQLLYYFFAPHIQFFCKIAGSKHTLLSSNQIDSFLFSLEGLLSLSPLDIMRYKIWKINDMGGPYVKEGIGEGWFLLNDDIIRWRPGKMDVL